MVLALSTLRQLCLLFYYARPETWAAIGYDGPLIETPRVPDSSVRYAELLQAPR